MSSPADGACTVGVALPVPDPWGEQLQRLREGYGEARARNIPTHITLLPPTEVSSEQVPQLVRHLEATAAAFAPFSVILRGTGTFRPVSEVVYVQVARGVSQCEQLQRIVRQGPVQREQVYPYHPHVTLAHDLPSDALDQAFSDLATFTASFQAREVVLYVHEGDEVWQLRQRFVLGRPAQAT